jgi:tetratricopeptide (TPR) repeat protein
MSCRTLPGRAAKRTAAPRADSGARRLRRAALLLAPLALATACLSQADKEKLEIHRVEATHYYDVGEYERAEEQCRAGLEVDDTDEILGLQLGYSLLMQATPKKLDEASELFHTRLGWFGSPDWRLSLGAGMADQERARLLAADAAKEPDKEKAAKLTERAAELRASARSSLDAADVASRAKENNAPPELLYHLSLLDLDEARYDLFRPHAEEAIALLRTADKFAAVQIRQQADDKERARLERARNINAERARRLIKELARIEWGREPKDLPAAAKNMKTLEEFGPLQRADYFNRGRILEATGDLEGAVSDYEKFLSLSADVADENVTRAVSSLQKLRAKLAELRTSAPAAASR